MRTVDCEISTLLEMESQEPLRWMYLSFADEEFKGAIIIEAHGIGDAARKAHAIGINPGGEVLGADIFSNLPPEKYRNRLLSRQDVLEFWPDSKSIREWEAQIDHN